MSAHGRALLPLMAMLALFVGVTAQAGDSRGDPRDNQVLVIDMQPSDYLEATAMLARRIGVRNVGVNRAVDYDLLTPALKGTYTFGEALRRLLTPIGLTYHWITPDLIYITNAEVPTPKPRPRPSPPASEKLESIVVIGTNVSDWINEADEIQVLHQRSIESYGVSTLPELSRYLTQIPFSNAGYPNQFGDQYANFRGLGPANTLVLINGRRVAPTALAYANGAFDINTIPLTAIERVEVLPNSPSILVGSEAIGGIINIVLKNKINEPIAAVHYGASDGGAAERRASLGFGGSSERFHGAVTLDFWSRDPLYADARKFGRSQDFRAWGGVDFRVPIASPGNVFSATGGNLPGLNAPFAAIPSFGGEHLSPNDFVATAGQLRLESLWRFGSIVNGNSRASLIGQGDWAVSSDVTAFAETQLTRRENRYVFGPAMVTNVSVPAANPYNPFGVPVLVSALFDDMTPRTMFSVAEFWRGVAGVRWNREDWHWELALTRSRDMLRAADENELDADSVSRALSATDPMTALNLFGGPGSPALLRSLLARPINLSFVADGAQLYTRLDGPLWSWRPGVARFAFGSEWREESAGSRFLPMDPHRSASAAFAELSIPLISATQTVPFVHELTVSFGAREDWYQGFAPQFTPQYHLAWHTTPAFFVRATYSDTYRIPSLYDTYSPTQSPLVPYIGLDPLRHNEPTTFTVILGGNPDLAPISGRTWSVGTEWNPQDTGAWHIALTYWQASIVGDVFPLSLLAVINRDDLFPGRVLRAAPSAADIAAGIPGIIQRVDVHAGNFEFMQASGIDLNASTHFDMAAGRVTPQLAVTWNSRYRKSVGPHGELLESELGVASEIGTVPRWSSVASAQWDRGAVGMFIAARFTAGYEDASNGFTTGQRIPSLTTFDTQFSLSPSIWQGMTLSAGAQNLLNTQPHFAQVGHTLGYDFTQNNLRGRFWYLRLLKTF